MKRIMGWIGLSVVVVGVSGCAAMKESLGSIGGLFGVARNVIETSLAAEVGGVYRVEITKGDRVLLSETWICAVGPNGKLTGCHKNQPQ